MQYPMGIAVQEVVKLGQKAKKDSVHLLLLVKDAIPNLLDSIQMVKTHLNPL